MEVIKKEIELDENHGYEYRVALPMASNIRMISAATSTIPWQAIAVYKFAYRHPYHKTYVYQFEGIELR